MLQIYTGNPPLYHIRYTDFIQFVVDRNVRPEHPEDDEAPQLSNNIWCLAEQCWVGDKTQRPTADDLCRIINAMIADSQEGTTLTPNIRALHLPSSKYADQTMTLDRDVTIDKINVTSHTSHTKLSVVRYPHQTKPISDLDSVTRPGD